MNEKNEKRKRNAKIRKERMASAKEQFKNSKMDLKTAKKQYRSFQRQQLKRLIVKNKKGVAIFTGALSVCIIICVAFSFKGRNAITISAEELTKQEELMPSSKVTMESYNTANEEAVIIISDIFDTGGTITGVSLDIIYADGNEKQFDAVKDLNNDTYCTNIVISSDNASNVVLSVTASVDIDVAQKEVEIFYYEGSLFLVAQDEDDFESYLHGLNMLNQDRYAILLTTQGNASVNVTAQEKEELSELGLTSSFFTGSQCCYGIFVNDDITYKSSAETITRDDTLPNGAPITVFSSNTGEQAIIIIDGIDYSFHSDGFNIAVYDMYTGGVTTYAYDTVKQPITAAMSASMYKETGNIALKVTDILGIDTDVKAVEAVIINTTDTDSIYTYVLYEDNGEWVYYPSIKKVDSSDLSVRIYALDQENQWHYLGSPVLGRSDRKE